MRNRWSEANKALQQVIASTRFSLNGCLIPVECEQTLTVTIMMTLCVWCDILQKWGLLKEFDFDLESRRWLKSHGENPVEINDLMGCLTAAADSLTQWIAEEEVALPYARFKHAIRVQKYSVSWMRLLKPLFDHVDALDFESQIYGIRDLYQALVFPLRVNPEFWMSDWKRADWCQAYCVNDACRLEFEFRIACQKRRNEGVQKFVQEDRQLRDIPPSRYIVDWWTRLLKDFVDTGAKIRSEYFRFGSGATVETRRGTCAALKWDTLRTEGVPWDILLKLSIMTGDDWMTPTASFPIVVSDVPWDSVQHPAHLKAVPKQWNKPRFISVEPLVKNLLQMGIGSALVDYLSTTRLRDHYIPDDQGFNAASALIGSYDGSFATIDLSSASDSVSAFFVNSATSQLPMLNNYLAWARSEYISVTYEWADRSYSVQFPQRKFAGMGNRLTFPIEVLVFASIICEAVRTLRPEENPWSVFWLVYGDDIVVPTWLADEVMALLLHYGFRVNTSKSFVSTQSHIFRESCGVFACDGIDVTPVRLSRGLQKFRDQPKVFPRMGRVTSNWPTSYVAIANEFYTHGFWRARLFVIESLFDALPHSEWPLFSDDPHDGLLSSQPTNFDKITVMPRHDGRVRPGMLYPDDLLIRCGRSVAVNRSELFLIREFPDLVDRQAPKQGADGEKPDLGDTSTKSRDKGATTRGEQAGSWFLLYETLRSMELLHPSNHEGEEPYRISEAFPVIGESSATTSKVDVCWRSVHVSAASTAAMEVRKNPIIINQ